MAYHCPYCDSTRPPKAKPPSCAGLLMGCSILLLVLGSFGLLCPLLILLPVFMPMAKNYCPDCHLKIN